MQKAHLIAQIQTERQNLENTLVNLNPEQLELPDAVGDWSVMDTLAHIAAWQQRLTDWLLEYAIETETQSPLPYGLDDEPLNRLNQQIYFENRGKTPVEVLRFFRLANQQTLEVIQGTPEKLLMQTIIHQGQAGPQVWEIIAANTFEHDQEHHNDILAWLASAAG